MFRRDSAVSQTLFFLFVLSTASLGTQRADAAGYVRFDSSSFLMNSSSQSNATTTLLLGPEMSTEGKWVSAVVDVKGVVFISDISSFTVEAGNLYLATSPQWMPHHQLTVGRRIYDWSEMEDRWDLGLWSARFLWNPLKPERIGLTGAFYTYESAKWRLILFGTPISPPERSFPIRELGGQLTAESRDYVPPYEALLLMNQVVPIHYTIQLPPVRELLVRPAAGMQVRYGAKDGPWASGSYGVMPMHQVQMSADAKLNPITGQVDAIVHPLTFFHHLATIEAGFRGRHWSVWGAASGESPIQRTIPLEWQTDPMGPALLTAGGGELRLDEYFSFGASYLGVDEDAPPPVDSDSVPLNMPSRFQYKRAFQLHGRWTGIPQLTADLHWTYDLGNLSGLVSFDLLYQPTVSRSGVLKAMFGGYGSWAFGIGADVISSATRSGYIGQYVGNDRVRGRISYAF